MTNKEVIDFLKSEKEATRKLASTCNSDKIDYFKKHEEAYDIAIKSMEAWDKAREEIKYHADNIKYTDAYRDGFEVSLKIIDKYLKEVENDK